MSLKLTTNIRFSVYRRPRTVSGREVTDYLIVTRDKGDLILDYTGLEYFAQRFTGRQPVQVKRDSQSLYVICHALNDILAHTGVLRLTDVTLDMIIQFVERYTHEPYDQTHMLVRGQQAIDKCILAVSSFFANMIVCFPDEFSFTADELFRPEYCEKRNTGRKVEMMMPVIRMKSLDNTPRPLYRDLTYEASKLLIQIARQYDPMIAFGIALGLRGGLRGGEIVNVRQANSPIFPVRGVSFDLVGDPADTVSGRSSITAMRIDLREVPLRSDGTIVGRVKRNRTVDIYDGFLHELYGLYQEHLKLLETFENNEEYCKFRPMFVTSNGKAMTKRTFYRRFVRLILDHYVPALLESGDEKLVALGHHLNEGHFGTHILRHSFSATLASFDGMTDAQLMYYRGDKRSTSSIPYLGSKSDLRDKTHRIHAAALDRMTGTGGGMST